MSKINLSLVAGALLAGSAPAAAFIVNIDTNLVTNGNFEAGKSGFTSDYTYTAPGSNALQPEATYTVDYNPNTSHPAFAAFGDHTSGDGLFMIVNGSSTLDAAVWTSGSIALTPGATYNFGAFLSTLYPDSPASLSFTITYNNFLQADGGKFRNAFQSLGAQSLGLFNAPSTTGVWAGFSTSFIAEGDSAVFSIINRNTAAQGNDFGIDDITLAAAGVPEPATWAMLLSGFGLVGVAARRRRPGMIAA